MVLKGFAIKSWDKFRSAKIVAFYIFDSEFSECNSAVFFFKLQNNIYNALLPNYVSFIRLFVFIMWFDRPLLKFGSCNTTPNKRHVNLIDWQCFVGKHLARGDNLWWALYNQCCFTPLFIAISTPSRTFYQNHSPPHSCRPICRTMLCFNLHVSVNKTLFFVKTFEMVIWSLIWT